MTSMRTLGSALRKAEAGGCMARCGGRGAFLALTGWRRGEVLGLRWKEVDLTRRTATLARHEDRPVFPAVVQRCLRCTPRPHASRRLGISCDARQGSAWRVSRNCGRGSRNSARCQRMCAARSQAFLCIARSGPRLFRTDHRRTSRSQGAKRHVAICPCG